MASMSKTEIIGFGLLGGMLGAGIVLGIAGGSMYHHQYKKSGTHLPMTLEMQTNAATPSTLHVLASVTRHRRGHVDKSKKSMAYLSIEPFKVSAAGSFSAVAAMPILPIPLVPVANSEVVSVDMFGADGKSVVKGTLAVGANGAIVLTAPSASADGNAWGLAKTAHICYEVADM